jgi:Flp pilus assembly protein TadG
VFSRAARRLAARLPTARGDERGAVFVFTALMMVVLLGFAALTVDVGFAYQQQRQVQNGADAAALGAAQDLPDLTSTASDAESLTSSNLPHGTFPWSSCTDSSSLAVVDQTTGCVSYDSSFTRVRVRVPTQSLPTFFGRVIGVNNFSTWAGATARVVTAGFGSIEPFALFSGFNAGLACLKQGPSGHRIASCDDPSTGNFNLLDITQYGNATLNTPTRCGNSFERDRAIDNIAIGADHMFTVYNGTELDDMCGQPGPNTIPPRTGNDVTAFDTGLVHGGSSDTSDGGGARLTRGQYLKTEVMGANLDNTPLWQFIPEQHLNDVPDSCQRSVFDHLVAITPVALQQVTLQAQLETCMTDYESADYDGIVFGAKTHPFGKSVPVDLYDIQYSPRFAYVPQFVQSIPPTGTSSNLNIASFRVIYMEDVYAGCNNSCAVDFAPGPWNTSAIGSSNQNAEAMTAWVIPNGMLPVILRGNPAAIGQNTYVQLIQ